ncbi:UNVERIFIED_CONTAM: hypothetical protein K2H54_071658 [Gekko kuhli]
MEPKPRLFKRAASPGARICSPPPGLTSAGPCCCPDGSPPAAAWHCGLNGPFKAPPPPPPPSSAAVGNAVYTVLVGDRRRSRRRSCEDGEARSPPGQGRLQLLQKAVPISLNRTLFVRAKGEGGFEPEKADRPDRSPTHCNGKVLPGDAEPANGRPRHLSDPLVLKRPEEEAAALRLLDQTPLLHSAYIPVPRQRCGKRERLQSRSVCALRTDCWVWRRITVSEALRPPCPSAGAESDRKWLPLPRGNGAAAEEAESGQSAAWWRSDQSQPFVGQKDLRFYKCGVMQ